MMDKRYSILIVSVTILVLSLVGTASATNWSVDGSGGADFTGIQDAINNAKEGDTILVYSGIYYENVVVDKSVTLRGIGHPIVDANGSDSAITLTADGITLEGFTVANSGRWSQYDAGINVNSNNNNIRSNNVSNNSGSGISLSFSSNNNTITGNNASNNRKGIYLSSSCSNTITSNTARNNFVGIYLKESCNNNITGNNVSNNDDGIDLFFSSNNNVAGNNVRSNEWGIAVFCSSNNTITGNNVSSNRVGIGLTDSSNNNTLTSNTFVNDSLFVMDSYHNTVEDNRVNGKPLVYLEDASDYRVNDAGQVILVNCNNITVENLDLSNTSVGVEVLETENCIISKNTVSRIFLNYSHNNTITGNNVSSNNYYDDGIFLGYSSNNTITGNSVCNNYRGIHLVVSCNNNIMSNNVSNNNWGGIVLFFSSNKNTITGNNVSNNYGGICLGSSSNNNTITGNTVSNNYPEGIYSSGSDNLIYLNNFINNTDNAHSSTYSKSTNIWNSPLEITYTYDGTTYKSYLGNYWDDYEVTDAEGDGIGDTHYSIDSEKDESDAYPLMKPFENYILP
ncbi:Cell surface glycoprotein [ANME-1 cluster archaeon GoMg3.2]|nr:Cell surface glycoprotein [ANME-1 cluster archaeon GoMg3.2]